MDQNYRIKSRSVILFQSAFNPRRKLIFSQADLARDSEAGGRSGAVTGRWLAWK